MNALLFFLTISLFFSTNAQAYVDPGVGYFLWQTLFAGFVGSLFFVVRLWRSFRQFATGRPQSFGEK
jgi:hypothetical protein